MFISAQQSLLTSLYFDFIGVRSLCHSRHAKVRASSTLVVWLNENVRSAAKKRELHSAQNLWKFLRKNTDSDF